jgi:hypothetical protein
MTTATMVFIGFYGVLSAYGEAPTYGTIAYRQDAHQIPMDLSPYDVLLAVDDCGLIGHEATLTVEDVTYTGMIFDCAGSDGAEFFSDGDDMSTPWKLAADVDYDFWMKHPELVGSGVVVAIEVER